MPSKSKLVFNLSSIYKILQVFLLSTILLSLGNLYAFNASSVNDLETDQYDGQKLTIPLVMAGGTIYRNVTITIDSVVAVNGGEAFYALDQYDPVTNQLSIPAVMYGGILYTNVVVKVGTVLKVGYVVTNGVQRGESVFCYKVDCVDGLSHFKLYDTMNPSSNPLLLDTVKSLNTAQQDVITRTKAYLKENPDNIGLLLIENDKIVFESYHPLINRNTPLYSKSVSKSLLSLAVGKAICNGFLPNINTKAKEINPILGEFAQGDATIKQLLTMTSGAARGTNATSLPLNLNSTGDPSKSFYYSNYLQMKEVDSHQMDSNGKLVLPGSEWSYKAFDPIAAGFLFVKDSKNYLPEIFQNEIWSKFGTENPSYWVKDLNGVTYTDGSFFSTLRDQARLAIGLKNIITSNGTDCFSNYLNEATSKQVDLTGLPTDSVYRLNDYTYQGYGYYFWLEGRDDAPNTIIMRGANGQKIAIDKSKNRIMIYSHYKGNNIYQMDQIFRDWK